MTSMSCYDLFKDQMKNEIDAFLQTDFPIHYQNFSTTILNAVNQLFNAYQTDFFDHVSTYLSSHLMNTIDQKWTEHVRTSPGKFKTGTEKKQAAIIDEISTLQKEFVVSYFRELGDRITSAVSDTLLFEKDKNKTIKLSTFFSEYLPENTDRDAIETNRTSKTRRRAIMTDQPQCKVLIDSMDDMDEPADVDDLKDLIAYGPLNEHDHTYKFVQKNNRLQKLEEGYLMQDFNKKVYETSWKEEFEILEKLTTTKETLGLIYHNTKVQALNRYGDVLPYTNNFVKLSPVFSGINTYINASFVSSSSKKEAGAFIVTQGPLESTRQDFWAMVLQENVGMIIMLCKLRAGSRPQSSDYYGETTKIEFPWLKGKIEKTERPMLYLTKRTIILKTSKGVKKRVTHFQWEGWPDHDVPDQDQYEVLIYLVKEMLARKEKKQGRTVVHCSAGIGRSGALMALHNIAQIIKKANLMKTKKINEGPLRISVFSAVRRLRLERFGMVQTAEQYLLVYKIIDALIRNPKLLEN